MIKGNKITLKSFETMDEVQHFSKLYNDISERGIHDHTEISTVFKRIDMFQKTKFWDQKQGKLMILNEDDIFIGTIGYVRKSEIELNVGYRLLLAEQRGKGYMTEALTLFVDHLFDTIPALERISLHTASTNVPSKKLAEKCGFIYEGTLRKSYFFRGEVHDMDVYSILKHEKK